MNKIENDLNQLCIDILLLLTKLKQEGKISESEFELHSKCKKLFISKAKSKLSI